MVRRQMAICSVVLVLLQSVFVPLIVFECRRY